MLARTIDDGGAARHRRDQGGMVEGGGGDRPPAHRSHRTLRHPLDELARRRARHRRHLRHAALRRHGKRWPDAGHRRRPFPRRAIPHRRPVLAPLAQPGAEHARTVGRRCASRASSSRATPTCTAPARSLPTPPSTPAWRPLVLDVRARDQREDARASCGRIPSLQVIDRLAEQREQLADVKPTPNALSLEDEPQRWIYYPWRRAVVRLLGPRSFGMLRLDRNRNKLTRAEQARQRRLRIGVVGLSAGHSIAHVLAMEGLAGELRLADFDTVELSNLNRIPGSVLDLGREQGGRGGAPHRRDRPVPAGRDDHRGHHAREPRQLPRRARPGHRGVRLPRREAPGARGGPGAADSRC